VSREKAASLQDHNTHLFFGQEVNIESREQGSGTPQASWYIPPPPESQDLVVDPQAHQPQVYINDDEQPRHSRSLSSYTAVPLSTNETDDRQNSRQDGNQTNQPRHSRHHSLTQSVSLDSSTPAASVYGTPGNALALTFDATAPFAVDTRGETHEQIRAPAPRMGGPNVLNLWRDPTLC